MGRLLRSALRVLRAAVAALPPAPADAIIYIPADGTDGSTALPDVKNHTVVNNSGAVVVNGNRAQFPGGSGDWLKITAADDMALGLRWKITFKAQFSRVGTHWLFDCTNSTADTVGFRLHMDNAGKFTLWQTQNAGSGVPSAEVTYRIGDQGAPGWYADIAYEVESDGERLYLRINGVDYTWDRSAPGVFPAAIDLNTARDFFLGTTFNTHDSNNLTGYLNDFTVYKKPWNYTAALLHGNGTPGSTQIVDSSLFNKTVTVYGNAAISAVQSKFNGTSIYLDGVNSWLKLSSNSLYTCAGDFTLDVFGFPLSSTGVHALVHINAGSNNGLHIYQNDGKFYVNNGLAEQYNGPLNSFPANAWRHLRVCKSGIMLYVFNDGVLVFKAVAQSYGSATQIQIGQFYNQGYFWQGYLAEFRFKRGISLHTEAQTGAPVNSVKLCLAMDGAAGGSTFTDSAGHTITANGAVTTSGNSSATFAGGYLSTPYSSAFDPGIGDYTLEGYLTLTNAAAYQFLFGSSNNSSGYMMVALNMNASGQIAIGRSGITWPVTINKGSAFPQNQRFHLALTRKDGKTRAFMDGVQFGATVDDGTSWQCGPTVYIGHQAGGTPIAGDVAEFRFLVGLAKYTANFTPPAMPLATTENYSEVVSFPVPTAPYPND